MAKDRKSLREILLETGGVVVTSISTAGLVLAAYLGTAGGGEDQEIALRKADLATKTEMCRSYFELLGDSTPREPGSAAERRAVDRMIVENARECTIYDDGLPLPQPSQE